MDSEDEDPNIEFGEDATAFLDVQSGLVQAEIIGIAIGLFHDPTPDGQVTFYRIIARMAGVRLYGTYYVGTRYWVYYENATDAAGRRKLWVHDCGPTA